MAVYEYQLSVIFTLFFFEFQESFCVLRRSILYCGRPVSPDNNVWKISYLIRKNIRADVNSIQ